MHSSHEYKSDTLHLIVGKTRVRDIDGFCGTVEYLGPVASAKNPEEIYAGVTWDDPSRGKHDGSVICRRTKTLVRHFASTGASFLRLSKIDTGIPLTLELLQTKYVEPNAPLIAPNNILPHTALTASGRKKPIEFHGEIKIRVHQQIDTVSIISLRNLGISTIDPHFRPLYRVMDLDLGGNLLCEWSILPDILQAFPNLTSLSLASNHLKDLDIPLAVQHTQLLRLNVRSCKISSFATILKLDGLFPQLQELCAAENDVSDLSNFQSISCLHSLRNLDMSDCHLTSWQDQINKFSGLQMLETLVLDVNPIPKIIITHENDSFHSLKSLSVIGLSVNEWCDIQDLASLTALRNLSFRNTPLTSKMGPAEVRAFVIARFPALESLNLSPILVKERSESEKRYIIHVAQEMLLHNSNLPEEKRQEFLTTNHPQYLRLIQKYGEENKHITSNTNVEKIASSTLNITIVNNANMNEKVKSIQKRFPTSLTVGRLKALCARIFGLDFDLQVLHSKPQVSEYICFGFSGRLLIVKS
jgi:tubulin-specific chaperone E